MCVLSSVVKTTGTSVECTILWVLKLSTAPPSLRSNERTRRLAVVSCRASFPPRSAILGSLATTLATRWGAVRIGSWMTSTAVLIFWRRRWLRLLSEVSLNGSLAACREEGLYIRISRRDSNAATRAVRLESLCYNVFAVIRSSESWLRAEFYTIRYKSTLCCIASTFHCTAYPVSRANNPELKASVRSLREAYWMKKSLRSYWHFCGVLLAQMLLCTILLLSAISSCQLRPLPQRSVSVMAPKFSK